MPPPGQASRGDLMTRGLQPWIFGAAYATVLTISVLYLADRREEERRDTRNLRRLQRLADELERKAQR